MLLDVVAAVLELGNVEFEGKVVAAQNFLVAKVGAAKGLRSTACPTLRLPCARDLRGARLNVPCCLGTGRACFFWTPQSGCARLVHSAGQTRPFARFPGDGRRARRHSSPRRRPA